MKYKNVIIFSLEGIESNTEINFFKNGLKHYVDKENTINLEAFAIGKEGNHKSSNNKIKRRLFSLMTLFDSILDESIIFFIGDGDAVDDIASMQRCKKTVEKYIQEKFPNLKISFHKDLIYEENISFDHILLKNKKIKDSNLINNKNDHKRRSNFYFFKNIIEIFIKDDLSSKKILKLMIKIFQNTKYQIIFETINDIIEK